MSVTIQRARPEDAPALIEYLNTVGGETDNLTFGAGEFPATVEEEAAYLRREAENPKSLMLTAWEGDGLSATPTWGRCPGGWPTGGAWGFRCSGRPGAGGSAPP